MVTSLLFKSTASEQADGSHQRDDFCKFYDHNSQCESSFHDSESHLQNPSDNNQHMPARLRSTNTDSTLVLSLQLHTQYTTSRACSLGVISIAILVQLLENCVLPGMGFAEMRYCTTSTVKRRKAPLAPSANSYNGLEEE